MFKSVFSTDTSDAESSDNKEMVDALLNAASFSKSDDGSNKGMSFDDFRSWCSHVPTIRKFLGSLLMPPSPARPGNQVPHLLYEDIVDSNMLLLKKEYAWHIGGALPHHELEEWKLLYHSSLHGQSFNTFLGHTSNTGMSASVIKDREGCVYGGYASQPWERHSDFYGDMKSFLFQLNPKASIFRPNWCKHQRSLGMTLLLCDNAIDYRDIHICKIIMGSVLPISHQENIPNGIGFGGKINHFGLFISASFDQGQTFSCTTFGSPSLSKTSRIQPEVIECWGIVQASNELDTQQNAMKGTVLERFKEDLNMLKLVGKTSNSNE